MTPEAALELLAQTALAYPESYQEMPWGHPAFKVRKKSFCFCGNPGEGKLSCSLKLPMSAARVLENRWATPTGYGLGKSGWVSMVFEGDDVVPVELLLDLLDESYRAVAPKTVLKKLGDARPVPVQRSIAPELPPDAPAILLVGEDRSRLARARAALAQRGMDALPVGLGEALEAAGEGAPDAVVVDLGRSFSVALPLLADLGLLCQGPVVAASVRADAVGQLPKGVHITRDPPRRPHHHRDADRAAVTRAWLRLLFPGGVPVALDELVDAGLWERLLEDYKVGPVFALGGTATRLQVSDEGECERWLAWVRAHADHVGLESFLASAPDGTRRMVDTDGHEHIVFLDDLQEVLGGGEDGVAMCATLAVPSGRRGLYSRHTAPPELGLPWSPLLEVVAGVGGAGLWGVKREHDRVTGLLWVSEARWRRSPRRALRVLAAAEALYGSHPGWHALQRRAARDRVLVYPDSIELRDGQAWVTAGFLRGT